MTRPSRRAENKARNEARILDAAIKVFAQCGYNAATMDMIAVEAGLSKPTLYQYFASKDELFKAMMLAPRESMMDVFEGDAHGDHVARLFAFAWRYADVVMRPDFLSLARLIIGEAQRFPEVGRAYQQSGPDKVLKGLMNFMEAQREAGHLAFQSSELAAQDFWGLILSGPRNAALHDPENIPDRGAIARSVHNGLAVFLRAYSTAPDRDAARLAQLIDAQQ